MLKTFLTFALSSGLCSSLLAQTDADSTFRPGGKLWGYTFGDYYFKAHADSMNRGGGNQYSGIEKNRNAFQIRRVYLGYIYNIHPHFTAEVLLAAEDNISGANGNPTGDLTANGKLTFYIKNASVRWKEIWKGTDIIIGLTPTPAFALLEDGVWNYRSVERTITDIRRMPSYDLGLRVEGRFDPDNENIGYNVMVGNGSGARPEADKFKHFYANVFGKFFEKRLVVALFADYERLNWQPRFHHARNMLKAFVAYQTPTFTAGIEAFSNHSSEDVIGTHPTNTGSVADTLAADAIGISTFMRGALVKNKLGYLLRYDHYNPDTKYDESYYENYTGLSSTYEPNNRENFVVAGLDYTPIANVHLMPNVWYNSYKSERTGIKGAARYDYDLVYRVTFYFVFGR
ncbi:MAG TPA: hypothetical protein VFI14_01395 [Chryseosolibacter sp.]|nr:hypothetical protein [Chryseosolibacter sp.]